LAPEKEAGVSAQRLVTGAQGTSRVEGSGGAGACAAHDSANTRHTAVTGVHRAAPAAREAVPRLRVEQRAIFSEVLRNRTNCTDSACERLGVRQLHGLG
jgi:hypothetical protein